MSMTTHKNNTANGNAAVRGHPHQPPLKIVRSTTLPLPTTKVYQQVSRQSSSEWSLNRDNMTHRSTVAANKTAGEKVETVDDVKTKIPQEMPSTPKHFSCMPLSEASSGHQEGHLLERKCYPDNHKAVALPPSCMEKREDEVSASYHDTNKKQKRPGTTAEDGVDQTESYGDNLGEVSKKQHESHANIQQVNETPSISPPSLVKEDSKIDETNKGEVIDWLRRHKLSPDLYTVLLENEMGDLRSLETAVPSMFQGIETYMTVIDKKKFQKALNELRGGGISTTPKLIVQKPADCVPTAVSPSGNIGATVTQKKQSPTSEDDEIIAKACNVEGTLRSSEECSSHSRLQLEVENEIKAIEHIIIKTRAVKDKDSPRFSEGALEILTNSRAYHQQRASRIQRLLTDHALYLERGLDSNAFHAKEILSDGKAIGNGRKVRFGELIEYAGNSGREITSRRKISKPQQSPMEKAKDEAALELQRIQEMERINKLEQEAKEQQAKICKQGGWNCKTCKTVNSYVHSACAVCNMARYTYTAYDNAYYNKSSAYSYSYATTGYHYSTGYTNEYDGKSLKTREPFYATCYYCKLSSSSVVGGICDDCYYEQRKQRNDQKQGKQNAAKVSQNVGAVKDYSTLPQASAKQTDKCSWCFTNYFMGNCSCQKKK